MNFQQFRKKFGVGSQKEALDKAGLSHTVARRVNRNLPISRASALRLSKATGGLVSPEELTDPELIAKNLRESEGGAP